jgi:hypothetical protein
MAARGAAQVDRHASRLIARSPLRLCSAENSAPVAKILHVRFIEIFQQVTQPLPARLQTVAPAGFLGANGLRLLLQDCHGRSLPLAKSESSPTQRQRRFAAESVDVLRFSARRLWYISMR